MTLASVGAAVELQGPGLTLQVTDDGRIVGDSDAGGFRLALNVEGHEVRSVDVQRDDGAILVVRDYVERDGRDLRTEERFEATADSVRWTVVATSAAAPWTAPVVKSVRFDQREGLRQWRPGLGSDQEAWVDPLETSSPTPGEWVYGRYQGGSLPIGTMLRPDADAAVSLIASPEELLLGLHVHTLADGVALAHSEHRFGEGRRAVFAADLVAHPADPRGALRWITSRYPDFFDPPQPAAHQLAGCGAYSKSWEIPDQVRLKKMAFRVNWNANFEWPYLGMTCPPVASDDEPWVCSDPYRDLGRRLMTYNRLNDYGRRMREAGFVVLNYFTTTEFGTAMKGLETARDDLPEDQLWKDPDAFAAHKIRDGVLPGKGGAPADNGWKNGYGMDCGGPAYRAFLIDQARAHVRRLPAFHGVCIDRLDWLNQVNRSADDGVGWYRGGPGRLVRLGWINLMQELGPIFQNRGQVVFGNPCSSYRLEVTRYLDGVYDEFGHVPKRLNASAMLCLRKPLLAWTDSKKDLSDDPDAYFQRHLHVGAYPTAPYPGNNHTIEPDDWSEAQYLAYGPLMDAYRGRVWVLEPHCVRAADGAAKTNLFEVPGGWVLPVTFADDKAATVSVRGVDGVDDSLRIDALLPGVDGAQPTTANFEDGVLTIETPVRRGCAMIRLWRPAD